MARSSRRRTTMIGSTNGSGPIPNGPTASETTGDPAIVYNPLGPVSPQEKDPMSEQTETTASETTEFPLTDRATKVIANLGTLATSLREAGLPDRRIAVALRSATVAAAKKIGK